MIISSSPIIYPVKPISNIEEGDELVIWILKSSMKIH